MKFKYWPHILIIILATLIRFVRLDQVPSSLYYDELDLGLQVRSFLQSGKDYSGGSSPFYFKSFITEKTPLPILFSVIPSMFFSSPELKVRAGTAIAGILVVALSMILSTQLTGSLIASIFTGIVFAFSPWLIQFSRMAFEAEYVLLLLFTYLTLFFQWLKTKQGPYLYLSAASLGLSIYTYRTMSFLAPILLIFTVIYFYKDFLKADRLKTLLFVLISLFFMLPFLYATTIGSKDQTRISQISIFSDPLIPIDVQRSRELVSGNFQNQTLGQSPTLWSKIFHNKPLSFIEKFRNNLLGNFSPQFLFTNGDQNGRHSAKNTGELLFLDLFALIAGIYVFSKNIKDTKFSFLAILLFLGAVPADLTFNGADHSSRLISFAGPLLIIVSLGYYQIYLSLNNLKFGKLALIAISFVWIFTMLEYTNRYFIHFPITNAREFGYGFKQAIFKINKLKDNYQYVELTDTNDPPMPYYLFWTNVSAKDIQNYSMYLSNNISGDGKFGKIRPKSFKIAFCDPKGISQLKSDTLYMVSDKNLPLDFRASDKDPIPQGLKVLDIIKYPDNEVAFYLITRDSVNGKEIDPLPTQKCK